MLVLGLDVRAKGWWAHKPSVRAWKGGSAAANPPIFHQKRGTLLLALVARVVQRGAVVLWGGFQYSQAGREMKSQQSSHKRGRCVLTRPLSTHKRGYRAARLNVRLASQKEPGNVLAPALARDVERCVPMFLGGHTGGKIELKSDKIAHEASKQSHVSVSAMDAQAPPTSSSCSFSCSIKVSASVSAAGARQQISKVQYSRRCILPPWCSISSSPSMSPRRTSSCTAGGWVSFRF